MAVNEILGKTVQLVLAIYEKISAGMLTLILGQATNTYYIIFFLRVII